MAINELPEEVLVRILSFLDRSDRLESALTCRRWAQIIARVPPLLRDVIVRGDDKAATVLANSCRKYENLIYRGSSRVFNAAFWTKIGPNLRTLEIMECDCPPEVFYSILQACSHLESLTIHKFFSRVEVPTFFEAIPPGLNPGSIQKSMRNLRHLHLKCFVDADSLEHLLNLMPNVSSIALRDFDERSDFLSRLPDILGKSRRITKADLYFVSRDTLEQLLRISSASLRSLRCIGNVLLPTTLDTLRNCSMLRKLDFHANTVHDTQLLQNILRNVPELESLTIGWSPQSVAFRREDLIPILDLKKLLKLDFNLRLATRGSDTYVPEEVVRDISRMITLERLFIRDEPGIVDSTRFRILVSMPNLRELKIERIQWDAECLGIVLFELRKLRMLKIHGNVTTPVLREGHSELERDIATPQDRFRSDLRGEQKVSSLMDLKILDIPLTDACLDRLTAHHSRLKNVWLSNCRDITEAGLVSLFQHEPLLERLELSHNGTINGTLLEGLGELCPRLRSLILGHCDRLSFQARDEFRLRRPRVQFSLLSEFRCDRVRRGSI